MAIVRFSSKIQYLISANLLCVDAQELYRGASKEVAAFLLKRAQMEYSIFGLEIGLILMILGLREMRGHADNNFKEPFWKSKEKFIRIK